MSRSSSPRYAKRDPDDAGSFAGARRNRSPQLEPDLDDEAPRGRYAARPAAPPPQPSMPAPAEPAPQPQPQQQSPRASRPSSQPTSSFNWEKDPIKRPRVRQGRYRRGISATRNLIEWVVIICGAIFAALFIKAFLLQAFYIPSSSMENTLMIGNRVLVNRASYRLHDVRRGDIVVFRKPTTPQAQRCYADHEIHDLIKRVVAVQGDNVESKSGTIYVNDKPVEEKYIKPGSTNGGEIQEQMVPPGHVWVMGDNRENSLDSRCAGPIPTKDILGRAFVVWWPLDSIRSL